MACFSVRRSRKLVASSRAFNLCMITKAPAEASPGLVKECLGLTSIGLKGLPEVQAAVVHDGLRGIILRILVQGVSGFLYRVSLFWGFWGTRMTTWFIDKATPSSATRVSLVSLWRRVVVSEVSTKYSSTDSSYFHFLGNRQASGREADPLCNTLWRYRPAYLLTKFNP